jgi:hypothetical protein
MEISDGATIKCNYESCAKVINKCNIQSKTPAIYTPSRENILTVIPVQHMLSVQDTNMLGIMLVCINCI